MKKRVRTKPVTSPKQETDWYDLLSPEQKEKIRQGEDDIKHGRTVKSEDVWKKYGR